MVLSRQYPLRADESSIEDEEQNLSPSDGYFRGRSAIPNAILLPDPSQTSKSGKAQEAALEARTNNISYPSSGSGSNGHSRTFTPATIQTTPSSSGSDNGIEHESRQTGHRYRDSVDNFAQSSIDHDEPPPMYTESATNQAPTPVQAGSSSRGDIQENMTVREPVPSSTQPAFTGRPSFAGRKARKNNCRGRAANRHNEASDEEAASPRWSRKRGCCGRRNDKERAGCCRKFARFVLLVFGVFLGIWLMTRLVRSQFPSKNAKYHHQLPVQTPPGSGVPANPEAPVPDVDRSIIIQHTSQSISGDFALYDLLDLATTSGSISITIIPHHGTKPAVVRLQSISGSINVNIARPALSNLPQRAYHITIGAKSGSVTGSLIHGGHAGSTTTLSTVSGGISLALYPVISGDGRDGENFLSTETRSGSTSLTVNSPSAGGFFGDAQAIRNLTASHKCVGSGSQNIRYPREWEGKLHAQTFGSGSINVAGRDLHFQQRGGKEVSGWKGAVGAEGKTIDITTVGSGSINFSC